MHRVTERIENRRQLVGNIVGNFERVKRRDHQIFGEAALTIDPDTHGITA